MSNDHEARRDTPLAARIKAQIAGQGPIPVSDYMRACLTDPEHGYYVSAPAIGRDGDFITAPEISQVFGELIGLWTAVVWQQMGAPARLNLVELGPGRGTLMRDALRASRIVEGFHKAISVHLVETSRTLRAAQQDVLAAAGVAVHWHDGLSEVPRAATVLVANEFLDALPISQIVRSGGAWRTRSVGVAAQGALAFVAGEVTQRPPAESSAAPCEGTICEFADGAIGLMQELFAHLGAHPLAALFIDYGHLAAAPGDTLQGVKAHRYVSPLEGPGETDLTAQVDFSQVGQAAAAAGLAVDGPATQAAFLGALGVIERASRLMGANPQKAHEIEAGIARLMAPGGMGTRFKVMGVRAAGLPRLPGL